eukprot:COSAG01_NODE_4759_length_4760_cov_2.330401_4_plen_109_part_00
MHLPLKLGLAQGGGIHAATDRTAERAALEAKLEVGAGFAVLMTMPCSSVLANTSTRGSEAGHQKKNALIFLTPCQDAITHLNMLFAIHDTTAWLRTLALFAVCCYSHH